MTKLHVDFSDLHRCAEQMGAANVDFVINMTPSPMNPIDIALGDGLEISIGDVSTDGGLLSYEGRQVLLFIKDHGKGVAAALADGKKGRRFHVADCKTLGEMRSKNRFERYFVTNDLSGEFEITGFDPLTNQKVIGTARLKVCKNCLEKLNYKGYKAGKSEPLNKIWNDFSIDEFFRDYSSCFKYLPHHMKNDDAQYTEDWSIVSQKVREERGFHCEQCGVYLAEYKNLLHVHHINGHKSDNRPSNLTTLCIDCHRKQEFHDHMFVSHKTMQLISRLRREQGIGLNESWGRILMLSDPAVKGVIRLVNSMKLPKPELGYALSLNSKIEQVELAWPDYKVAVVITSKQKKIPEALGWHCLEMIEVLDRQEELRHLFGRF